MDVEVKKIKKLSGSFEVPADKSISHRAAMLSCLTKGKVRITNYSKGEDCQNTLKIMQQLGAQLKFYSPTTFDITCDTIKSSDKELYVGNSGTAFRLLSGILAGQNFSSVLTGDESLSKRPMRRIIEPLTLMGADIKSNDFKAPLAINGKNLHSIEYNSPIASAQVKSALLFAGLHADGRTSIIEPCKSRDHSENMLKYLGANIIVENNKITISKSDLIPKDITIPGDISSAAFFMVAAAICPNSCITIKNVNLNQTRTGIIDVLKMMKADIVISNQITTCEEVVGDVTIKYSNLKATIIEGDIIPRLIDELPIIAILASQAEGTTIIKNAQDLRNKESDRIKTVCEEFKKLGVDITEKEDGFIIKGKSKLQGDCTINTYYDHRIAMSAYIAGLICLKPILIKDFQWVNTSFPEFLSIVSKINEE